MLSDSESDPFIITLQIDEKSFAYLDGLRKRYFPPERNVLAAHITLFHKLPGNAENETRVREVLASVGDTVAPFSCEFAGLRSLGRGVAITISAPPLLRLHRKLVEAFREDLSPQDLQKFQPHVTIQNKVAPEVARQLLNELSATWQPFTVEAIGLHLWRYRNGPWESAGIFPFGSTFEKSIEGDHANIV